MLRFFSFAFAVLTTLGLLAIGGVLAVFWHYGRDLPDHHQLEAYNPPVTTRVYAGDGRLVAEYAVEKRNFVPLNAIPQRVKQAFMAAEDKNFYNHPGIDVMGVGRAMLTNLKSMGSDRRPVGASTVTQQVAKNFLLSNEVSMARKVKELILALRMERAFTKDHILELYLNEIYLGMGSYGVAAAAMNYFNRGLDQLSVAELAYLAALPKAPNNYNPFRHPLEAKGRRDWVIGRMLEDGYITAEEAKAATEQSLEVRRRSETELAVGGDYFAEDIRRDLASRYGEGILYKGGLTVRSTMDPVLQDVANRALRNGLTAYDRRHGWRGAITRIEAGQGWPERLVAVVPPSGLDPRWRLAVVLGLQNDGAEIGLASGEKGRIPFTEMKWARPTLDDNKLGAVPRKPGDVVQVGDVVAVELIRKGDDGANYAEGIHTLRQIPKVEGALVAMDPHTGRVLAMVGGFSYQKSQFNRATQAQRQPGSSFKPFIYLAALDSGYTPSSLVLDAPLVLDQGPGMPKWKPSNYSGDFLGPTTLRVGIEKSRNLMTVRLAQALGMDTVADYAQRFGVTETLPKVLSMSLGAGETTVLRMTAGYAQFVNGGKRIKPTLIDRIQDRNGKTIYVHDTRPCPSCTATFYTSQEMPRIPDTREQITDPISAYQMVSILQGVVDRGTGSKVAAVGKPLAGKTGTSNDSHDTWFVGFGPDLAAGVFVGFDDPVSMGDKETGGSVAAPIFRDFMMEALKDKPATPFRIPSGVRLVRVNAATGQLAQPGDRSVILEAFKADHMPTGEMRVLDGSDDGSGYGGFTGFTGTGFGGAGISPSDGGGGAGGAAPDVGGLY